MRRQTKWVFAFLAVVFAGSFVFLGVGSGGSALTDFLNGNIHLFGSSSGPSAKSLEKKVAKDPTNPKLRLQLAQLFQKKSATDTTQLDPAIAAYTSYLKLKPKDQSALGQLGLLYGSKVSALQTQAQSPPTPPLSILNDVLPVSDKTVLGTALSALQSTTLNITSLQTGETDLINKQRDQVITKHLAVYRQLAALNPGDSSKFLETATQACNDGDVVAALGVYQGFLKRFPNDPLTPDIKKGVKTLEKNIASGTSSCSATGSTG